MRRILADGSPRVAVVVLSWNGRDDTLECLASLRAVDYPNWEVLVVDNGSKDDSVDGIRKRYPEVLLIEAGRNLGFAGGNNVGLHAALERGAEFIVLLNNDTTVAPDLLRELVRAAHVYPDAGVLSAKICFRNDPRRIWYAGTRWDLTSAAFQHVGQGAMDDGTDFERIGDTEYACGCAMFLRASVVRAIGPLDERFFLLFEDTDWCFRARKAGYRCLFVPRARVWHRVSASLGGQGLPMFEYFYVRNRLLWAEKHVPVSRRIAVWLNTLGTMSSAMHVIDALCQLLLGRYSPRQLYWEIRLAVKEWCRGLGKPGTDLLQRARRQGVLDYLARRFGDCPMWLRAASVRSKARGYGARAA
jgi:GT2 family glycosyltransferase